MKKSKILMIAGACTLAIVSIYGTKPAKRFVAATHAYAGGAYLSTIFSGATASALTTVRKPATVTFKTAFFKTVNGAAVTLVTAVGSTKRLYLHK